MAASGLMGLSALGPAMEKPKAAWMVWPPRSAALAFW